MLPCSAQWANVPDDAHRGRIKRNEVVNAAQSRLERLVATGARTSCTCRWCTVSHDMERLQTIYTYIQSLLNNIVRSSPVINFYKLEPQPQRYPSGALIGRWSSTYVFDDRVSERRRQALVALAKLGPRIISERNAWLAREGVNSGSLTVCGVV